MGALLRRPCHALGRAAMLSLRSMDFRKATLQRTGGNPTQIQLRGMHVQWAQVCGMQEMALCRRLSWPRGAVPENGPRGLILDLSSQPHTPPCRPSRPS